MKRLGNILGFVFVILLLAAALSAVALADFNPGGFTITTTDTAITVSFDADNDEILRQYKPEVAVPCDFADSAKVTGPNGPVECTPEEIDGVKVVTFQVAQAGTYVITKVTTDSGSNSAGNGSGAYSPSAGAGSSAGGGAAASADAVEIQTNEDGTLTVTIPDKADGPVKVEIPVENAGPGTVVILVHDDGAEEIVKTTQLTEAGLALTLEDSCTIRIADNTKTFTDVPEDNWAADAVTFVTARGIFLGTGEDTFDPDVPMTRGMLMTVLARLDGADAYGEDWQEKGIAWAMERGISDGSDPETPVTREQLVVMLWRYAGSPAPTGDLSDRPDGDKVSSWAADALAWAVESGIMHGDENGRLDPQGPAVRAQVAQFLMNFINAA